jgi:hypothetical protein
MISEVNERETQVIEFFKHGDMDGRKVTVLKGEKGSDCLGRVPHKAFMAKCSRVEMEIAYEKTDGSRLAIKLATELKNDSNTPSQESREKEAEYDKSSSSEYEGG